MGDAAAQFAHRARTELGKVIVGQEDVVRQLPAVLLAGGHALVEGVPGIAKTLAVKALAHLCHLDFQRVQCRPNLMPADILGVNVYSAATGAFTFRRGPVFTDLLLVDEVNRMPPRTQAALLECMEERQVTLDGTRSPSSSQSSPRRIRWISRARIPCRKPSSTGSCSKSGWDIPRPITKWKS